MDQVEPDTRECPFCKETVKSMAFKCKHCHALLIPARPSHGGLCPYCKEEVNKDAVRCKYCKSDLRVVLGNSSILGMGPAHSSRRE